MSEKRIRELFELSPTQQVRHWGRLDPWEDMKLENKTEVRGNQVVRDGQCNITRMPLLLKPCFGQPLAFARHGGNQPIFHPRFGTVPSRCMRCLSKEACETVAKARLRVTSAVHDAYVRFERAGGSFGLKHPSDCPTAQRQFDGLVAVLCAHGGFTSSNDPVAIAELKSRDQARKLRQAEKKRLSRRKAIRGGDLDPAFVAVMETEAHRRALVLIGALLLDGLPANINRMPAESAYTTADVWFIKETMRLRGEAVNPSAIAHGLIKKCSKTYPPARHNALRQRIPTDLKRIATLERLVPPGRTEPIWPRFDLAAALDELDLVSPYKP